MAGSISIWVRARMTVGGSPSNKTTVGEKMGLNMYHVAKREEKKAVRKSFEKEITTIMDRVRRNLDTVKDTSNKDIPPIEPNSFFVNQHIMGASKAPSDWTQEYLKLHAGQSANGTLLAAHRAICGEPIPSRPYYSENEGGYVEGPMLTLGGGKR